MHAVGQHVGHEEGLAVGRDADVLRHAARGTDGAADLGRIDHGDRLLVLLEGGELGHYVRPFVERRQHQGAEHDAIDHVDLGDGAVELAGEEHVCAVDREVGVVDAAAASRGDRELHLHRLRIAEVEPLQFLGHDDRVLAVGRPIDVVGIVDRDRLARLAGQGIDRRQAAVGAAFGVVGDPQRLEVPRRHDVLRIAADLERVDHLQRRGVDHRHRVRTPVGDIDPRQRVLDGGAELAGLGLAVEVGGIEHGRHARHAGDGGDHGAGLRHRPPAASAARDDQDNSDKENATEFHAS